MIPTNLIPWAQRHGVSAQALAELGHELGIVADFAPALATPNNSEAHVQSLVRLRAPGAGIRAFRNNVGVLKDERGVPVRYGLANDSPKLNDRLKSSDLIGWRRRTVTPDMVGGVIAQFWSAECKRVGWTYTGTPREVAQLAWIQLVVADGGDAKFTVGEP